jgi:hypothetical protein
MMIERTAKEEDDIKTSNEIKQHIEKLYNNTTNNNAEKEKK